jgi:hypothetical protein
MTTWILMFFLSANTLLRQTFEDGTAGWVAVGPSGAVRVTHEDVKNGSGALAFDYTVGAPPAVAALPLNGTSIAQMDALHFWMKTDLPTALGVVINEKRPGGNYTAICWSTGNTWQRVELRPGDFHLNEGPNDPADTDGKLDLDAAQNIGIIDLRTVLGSKTDPDLPIVVESHAGKHSLFLDDFEILSGVSNPPRDPAVLDDFATPQLRWLTLGGVELKPEGAGMRALYQQMAERSVLMLRPLGNVDLRGKEWLAFDIASERPAQLLMSFEERAPGKPQGPRYNALVEVVGGGKVNHREILLEAFEYGPDSPADPDGVLDPNQLKHFSIMDVTGTITHETVKNSLWIGNIRGAGGTAAR